MLGIGADRVLIAAGAIGEESYLRALADALDVPFEPLDDVARAQCPLDDERLIESAAAGMLPLMDNDELCLVVAPRGMAAHRFARAHDRIIPRWHAASVSPPPSGSTALCCATAARRLPPAPRSELQAVTGRRSLPPRRRWRGHQCRLRSLQPVALAAAVMAPAATLLVIDVTLAAVFLAWLGLRFAGALIAGRPNNRQACPPTIELPVYTVIAALYREAASVGGLLTAIERLDYPPEKLDVIVAIEADDRRHARSDRRPPEPPPRSRSSRCRRRVRAPSRKRSTSRCPSRAAPSPSITTPRTGRSRTSCADALRAFGAGGDQPCLRAGAAVHRQYRRQLARAAVHRRICRAVRRLPARACRARTCRCRSAARPIISAPRRLRDVGGWDPYNVTEDADLGMRLARFGYRVGHDRLDHLRGSAGAASRPGCASARAGSRAGCRPGWCICARRAGCCASSARRAFSPSSSLSAAMCWRRWCIRLFLAGLSHRSRAARRCGAATAWRVTVLAALYGDHHRRRLSDVGLSRLARPDAARPVGGRLGAAADAAALAAAVARGLARALSARRRALCLGKDRARPGEKLAAGTGTTRSLLELERYLRRLKDNGLLPALWDEPRVRPARIAA